MTDNLCNCLTCDAKKNMRSRYGMNCIRLNSNIEPTTVQVTGCLYHPLARQELMKPVIEELERLQIEYTKVGDLRINTGLQYAIDLLRNGVKKS